MYSELHAASAFSFLRGSSSPEDLVARAAELGLPAVALCDRDSLSGAPRFFKAARLAGVRPLVGAELSLAGGGCLTLLVQDATGYRHLCRLITDMKSGVAKGAGRLRLEGLSGVSGLIALAGEETPDGALPLLIQALGRNQVAVEVQRHRRREREVQARASLALAQSWGVSAVATNGVRHARPQGRALLDVFTCIREKVPLARAGRLLTQNTERHLKAPAEMQAVFADLPELLRANQALSERLQFTLTDLGYRFPRYPVPPTASEHDVLRAATERGARDRYRPYHERARRQVERELQMIGKLGLSGYFLIVWDIVNFCRRRGSWSRAAARPRTARSATASASPRSIRWAWTCCSSASSPRSGASGRTSTSTCRAETAASG